MLLGLTRNNGARRRNVSDDWIRPLARAKNEVFETTRRQWESWHAMMSIALDESLSLCMRGQLVCARQQVAVTSDLLKRLVGTLIGACDAIENRGGHLASLPVVEPMRSGFFRGDTARSAASWNSLLHSVLLGDRSRFFHKVHILSGTLEQLFREFDAAAAEISQGTATQPAACWRKLESLHYDVTTCLREAEVMLKSFLHTLPAEQVASFSQEITIPRQPKKRSHSKSAASRISA